MVKGISRRVIVVRHPDRRLFEQAIFIVKEDALNQGGVTAEEVLDEARRVADGFVRRSRLGRKKRWSMPLLFALAGALGASLLWCLGLVLR